MVPGPHRYLLSSHKSLSEIKGLMQVYPDYWDSTRHLRITEYPTECLLASLLQTTRQTPCFLANSRLPCLLQSSRLLNSHPTVITDVSQVSLMIPVSVTNTKSHGKSEARRGIGHRFPKAEGSSLITRSFADQRARRQPCDQLFSLPAEHGL